MRLVSTVHVALYRCSGGRIGSNLRGLPILLLTTTGRRSNRRRTVALVYLRDGDDLVVVGSNGGNHFQPSWLLNLRANPQAEVQINAQRKSVVASTATGSERERLWPKAVKLWPGYAQYQQGTSRLIPLIVLRTWGTVPGTYQP